MSVYQFTKYHGLGNDYLVCEGGFPEREILRFVRAVCHRNVGIGSDGILLGPLNSELADFKLRIFNPDGSEAEKSGNGLRIFARHLIETGRAGRNSFTVETLGGVVTCRQVEDHLIQVEMGNVSFKTADIPMNYPAEEALNLELGVGNQTFRVYAASIGNPHCVIPVRKVSKRMAIDAGPFIENHSLFPERTNVQFMEVVDRQTIRIEIWERGAGYTLASGSSSSAAGAVARKMGLVDPVLTVQMPGGSIQLEIDENYRVLMTGPVTKVCQCVLEREALESPVVDKILAFQYDTDSEKETDQQQ